ncbi:MAG: GldG family protein [Candidatus Sericytochromatia bacterium]
MKEPIQMSLKRLSLIIGLLGLVALSFGFGLATQANFKDTAELLQVAGLVIAGIGGVGLLIAWRESLYGFSRTRQARYGANAVLLSLSFIGVVVLLNYLAFRHDLKWDLTEGKSFTLSDQSEKILTGLDKDVKVTAFYRASNSARQETLNRLESYRDLAKEHFKFEMVDPERQPGITLKYGVTSDGTLILESGTARKEIFANSEEQLTSALLAVTRSDKPRIYFLTGHNELDPDNFDPRTGLSNLKTLLEQENYATAKLSLAASGKIPADCRALVIAGPDRALTQAERQLLQEYIEKRQGKLLIMLPPRVNSGLEALLQTYGVNIGNNIVVDPGRNIQNDLTVPAFNEFGFHPVTKELGRTAVFLPLARSVGLSNPPKSVQGTELMKTTPSSWAETNLKENSLIQKDPGDPSGPIAMAVALTIGEAKPDADQAAKTPQARMLVVGNAMFAANWFSRLLGNSDFFLNTIAWLTEAEDLISIRAKPATERTMTLTGQQEQIVFYLSIVIMPALMVLLGILVWWRRR